MIRKIKSQEDIEKKRKRNQVILGVSLAFLMLLSTAGFSIMSRDDITGQKNSLTDSGFEFTREGNYWILSLEGRQFFFQNLPSTVKDVPIEGTYSITEYSGSTVYFVNSNDGTNEILQNIYPSILRYQEACLEGTECSSPDLPVKTCSEKMIISSPEGETRVYKEDNCVYLMGDVLKSADAFLYKILGII